MSKNGRILVAMSGGVDSSVTAAMLHDEGYEVVGITMKTWDYASSGGTKKETGCCSLDSINDARDIAVSRGFSHFIVDIREEFGGHVINNFVEEYLAGRTPNPCVMCNTHIKWEALLRRADKMDCEFIATGHYAQIREENNRYVISRGVDVKKDQSYVLWGVSQECLKRTLFPVGGYHKPEIREMANVMGFTDLAKKSESYEICFIPDNDYRGFLRRQAPEIEKNLEGGNFVLSSGKVVGKHQGYPYYTIGQRKGIVAMGEPYYVTQIDPETNTVYIGKEDELYERRLTVRGLNMVKYDNVWEETPAISKIRYNTPGSPSLVRQLDDHHAEIFFDSPVKAIAPGQAAVFYDENDVIGGGWIEIVGNN